MDCKAEEKLVDRFHEAVSSGQIRAFFQPIMRSMTQQIIGVESLARWFHPDGSILAPDLFIPSLEQNGLIFELDMEILRQACILYDEFRHRGTTLQCVSVNLSRMDFGHEDLFERVCSVLDMYSVPHEAIKLEITESLMLEDTESFEKIFRHFSEAGFSVWLDDFGSGYSSLNVLQSYSFDVIKFDMLFLRELSVKGREVLASLVSMAKTLGIHTLTEGVETNEHREFLLSIGCEAQQGFFYARPLSKEELMETVDQKPGILEGQEEIQYWNEVGQLNLVNPNPLKEFQARRRNSPDRDSHVSSYDGSIALVECGQDRFSYIYATEGYKERLRELGFTTIGGLESALSNQRSHQFLMIRKLVLEAIQNGTIQTVEYSYKDVYYRLSALPIAKRKGRVMIVMRLNTFDLEREAQTAKEMLNNSSALLTTYELVVMLYPESRVAKRIYTANAIPEYDREASLEKSIEKFCRAEVDPVDQERYLRFIDFKTMAGRIGNSPKLFIQGLFRMRLENRDRSRWYIARVTQIPTFSEPEFMLTVQNIQGDLNQWLDIVAREHPEML